MAEAKANTDREIWREHDEDYYSPSIFVTEGGGIGINVGGYAIVAPVKKWHDALRKHEPAAPEAEPRKDAMKDGQIKYMVDRFLGWRLPEDFNPDGGISFVQNYTAAGYPMKHEPTGTNLFDATQAEEMIRYLVDGIPSEPAGSPAVPPAQHEWVGRQVGGSPVNAESYEWVRYCDVCGMEDSCEDGPIPPCPGAQPSPQPASAELPPLPKPIRKSEFWDEGIEWCIAGERAATLERERQLLDALTQLAALQQSHAAALREGKQADLREGE